MGFSPFQASLRFCFDMFNSVHNIILFKSFKQHDNWQHIYHVSYIYIYIYTIKFVKYNLIIK
jgi:hypothetical protein